ncbi:MAG: DNA primase [Bacteroidia bacterium]|nr:DNA primase [Bacteroidia bacterium]MCO5253187.1 DNA primase [Bacteroidota bacterium]MCZ2128798.1 DNA primase [Bacteroidia bacterium]
MEKKRVIIDYSVLPKDILAKMEELYPDGFENDVIRFPNAKGEFVYAVRVETDTTIYLVKVNKQIQEMMEEYDEEDYDNDEKDVSTTLAKNNIPKGVIPDEELEDDEEEDDYDNSEDVGDDEDEDDDN